MQRETKSGLKGTCWSSVWVPSPHFESIPCQGVELPAPVLNNIFRLNALHDKDFCRPSGAMTGLRPLRGLAPPAISCRCSAAGLAMIRSSGASAMEF